MKGDEVPTADHISRYVGGSHFDPESVTVRPTAFMLQEKDDDLAVSVNWLEHLPFATQDLQITEIRRVFTQKMKLGRTAKFAVMNVGMCIENVKEITQAKVMISVKHDPKSSAFPDQTDDPSHSGIYGLPPNQDDDSAAVAISEVVMRLYPANT